MVNQLAKEIYTSMRFERFSTTPNWVEGGNSLAQIEARDCATRVLDLVYELNQQLEDTGAKEK